MATVQSPQILPCRPRTQRGLAGRGASSWRGRSRETNKGAPGASPRAPACSARKWARAQEEAAGAGEARPGLQLLPPDSRAGPRPASPRLWRASPRAWHCAHSGSSQEAPGPSSGLGCEQGGGGQSGRGHVRVRGSAWLPAQSHCLWPGGSAVPPTRNPAWPSDRKVILGCWCRPEHGGASDTSGSPGPLETEAAAGPAPPRPVTSPHPMQSPQHAPQPCQLAPHKGPPLCPALGRARPVAPRQREGRYPPRGKGALTQLDSAAEPRGVSGQADSEVS